MVAPRWLFVRVETSGGLVGWGEASCEGRSETVRTAVHQLAEYLIGQDPFRIEDHWQVMSKGSFYRHGVILSSAVAGLDQALWDLLGKSVGLPVHVLGRPIALEVKSSGSSEFMMSASEWARAEAFSADEGLPATYAVLVVRRKGTNIPAGMDLLEDPVSLVPNSLTRAVGTYEFAYVLEGRKA